MGGYLSHAHMLQSCDHKSVREWMSDVITYELAYFYMKNEKQDIAKVVEHILAHFVLVFDSRGYHKC